MQVLPYQLDWKEQFEKFYQELRHDLMPFQPLIQHIGSTAIPHMPGRPMIDILVGWDPELDLNEAIEPLIFEDWVYYKNETLRQPQQRFFVFHDAQYNAQNLPLILETDADAGAHPDEYSHRVAQLQIVPWNSPAWLQPLALTSYLQSHPNQAAALSEIKTNFIDQISGNTLETYFKSSYHQVKKQTLDEIQTLADKWYDTKRVKL
jgi:GrpB-like predicted nucleotidyltransferase (UPF0157 family)